jgi:hypothetical protein
MIVIENGDVLGDTDHAVLEYRTNGSEFNCAVRKSPPLYLLFPQTGGFFLRRRRGDLPRTRRRMTEIAHFG